jgi:hypothetical protein
LGGSGAAAEYEGSWFLTKEKTKKGRINQHFLKAVGGRKRRRWREGREEEEK